MIKHISNSSLNLRKFLNKKSTIYISRPFILVEKHKKKSKDICNLESRKTSLDNDNEIAGKIRKH